MAIFQCGVIVMIKHVVRFFKVMVLTVVITFVIHTLTFSAGFLNFPLN